MNLLSSSINWQNFTWVLVILGVLCIIFTILILVINKFCAVEENPKIAEVAENLSGANCGGCGYAGCADFAKALVEGRANINDCAATAKESKIMIATILGVEVKDAEPMMAVVKCVGNNDNTTKKFNYVGIETCEALNAAQGGDKLCSYGCLGKGSCELVCKFNAMTVENGLATNKFHNCTACSTCVRTCPKHIIELIPRSAKVYIGCSSKCKGKEVMSACKNGCIACGICAKSCPSNAITMVDNLPVIDYNKCTKCGLCADKCPRKCIIKL